MNFKGDASNLNNISEYLIAKDYSSHLILLARIPSVMITKVKTNLKTTVLQISSRIIRKFFKKPCPSIKLKPINK